MAAPGMHKELIKAHLRIAGSSVTKIARELELHHSTVLLVVEGRGTSARVASRVAEVLGKPVAELWPGAYPALESKRRQQAAKAR